ncbi:RNA-guided endonuclease InsQ/TnpB family protein [Nitrococcus mobilis]|uniref:Transposase, IS605 OrfB n=1 Tax=Nitrococcus mobilis Nb-231 TaxID=314278 RepID=A4BRS5_9GAMM|nr:RNA-guided endonuclease TnpB family protein [Nitrococcus mobilis]EAR21646.1 transposase, IS605 OrfB [Nitrococcus mobilis Nb-231]
MKLRWSFRCYPTSEQERILARTFGCARFVYNRFLAERTAAFQRGDRMNYNQSSAGLSRLKRDPDYLWLNEVSSVPTQQALRHLQTAFRNFFDKRAGYPSFKKKEGRQTAEYTRSAFKFEVGNQRLIIAKLGRLKVKWSKHVPVNPTSATLIRMPSGRYFVSLVVDVQPAPLPQTGESVGVDFGISRLATLSNGDRVANPKYLNRYRRRMARIQKDLARKQKGSNRRWRCKRKLARLHEKVTNFRKDTINKLAWSLVTRFDTIAVEDLNLRGMVKNHSLARSLSDAAIGSAIRAIEAKAAMHDKTVVKIDRWFPSSKLCSACGCLQSSMPLSVRQWTCECGASHDRDENAARNILAVGHTATAHGDGVSPH